MSRPRTAVIVNPRAGGGRMGRRWGALAHRMAGALGSLTTRFTGHRGHAEEIALELLEAGCERVIAAGGDGTLSEAANGFMRAGASARASACLGFLPCGRGADFARTLGMPRDLRAAADALASACAAPSDIGLARYRDAAGAPAARYFLNVASFGIGGEVTRRRLRVPGGYFAGAALALARHRGAEIDLALDGGVPRRFRIAHTAVGNGGWQGSGMHLCPGARIDDGLLEITVIADVPVLTLIRDYRHLYSGKIGDHAAVTRARAAHIAADGPDEAALEADGEHLGSLPAVFTVLPAALRLMRPTAARV